MDMIEPSTQMYAGIIPEESYGRGTCLLFLEQEKGLLLFFDGSFVRISNINVCCIIKGSSISSIRMAGLRKVSMHIKELL
jgi:hypothetical protein